MKIEHLTPGKPQRIFLPPTNTCSSSANQLNRNRYGWTTGEVRQKEQPIRQKGRAEYSRTKTEVQVTFNGSGVPEWRDISRLRLAEVQEVAA